MVSFTVTTLLTSKLKSLEVKHQNKNIMPATLKIPHSLLAIEKQMAAEANAVKAFTGGGVVITMLRQFDKANPLLSSIDRQFKAPASFTNWCGVMENMQKRFYIPAFKPPVEILSRHV